VRCDGATGAPTVPAMKAAIAATLVLASITAASASPTEDRPTVAWASARDVVDTVRERRALVRKSHPRRHHGRRHAKRIHGAARVAGRPWAWCGWWLGHHLGLLDRKLWLARNWASVGHRAPGPGVGVIVVWRHHVGIITGRTARGWVVKSGNDGHAVRERVRSVSGAIAYRVRS
jgi:hypothetical protein